MKDQMAKCINTHHILCTSFDFGTGQDALAAGKKRKNNTDKHIFAFFIEIKSNPVFILDI